jgi:four helix bundle protein
MICEDLVTSGWFWCQLATAHGIRFVMMAYERLRAWRSAHRLAVAVYQTTQSFPKSELYGLTSQMRRAAFSIPANIAEGSAKRGPAEFRRFLDIAVGSFAEVSYALLFSRDVGLLPPKVFDDLEPLRVETGKLTWGLYATIAKRARAGSRGPEP